MASFKTPVIYRKIKLTRIILATITATFAANVTPLFTSQGNLSIQGSFAANVTPVFSAIGGEPPLSDWILAVGVWNDAGLWYDTELWNDAP